METFTRVYVWTVEIYRKWKENENYRYDTFTDLAYTKDEALKAMFDAVRVQMAYYESERFGAPARHDMLLYKKNGEEYCKLYVDEYSANRRKYADANELVQKYQGVIAEGGVDLYDRLLALVSHNREYYNTFMEKSRSITIPQKVVGVDSVGSFVEEECANGKFCGTFRYSLNEKQLKLQEKAVELFGDEVKEQSAMETIGTEPKLYFGFSSFICKKGDPKDQTNWRPKYECYYSLEEAIEGIRKRYFDVAEKLVDWDSNISRDMLKLHAEKCFHRSVLSVLVVSGERIRFESEKELRTHYVERLHGVKAEDMYDFLLRYVAYDERYYDADGEYLFNENRPQPACEYDDSVLPEFGIETAGEIVH